MTGVQTCALPILEGMGAAETMLAARDLLITEASKLDVLAKKIAGRDRKSVVSGKSVDLGGRRIIKKKKEEREHDGRAPG